MTLSYGSVREALKLGSAESTKVKKEEQRAHDDDNMIPNIWSPPVVPGTDRDSFWRTIYEAREKHAEISDLRTQVIEQARSTMRAELMERKQCPNRNRIEQRLLEQWQKAAAPTAVPETPRLHRTPDPLHSPFPRF